MSLAGGVGVREEDLPWVDIGVRPGYDQRYKGFFDKERGVGARIGSLYTQEYFHSPRHAHTFQQVRYVVSGQLRYGHETYVAGDCFYLPEGVPYGPIKPVRGAVGTDAKAHYVDMQFMGPSGIPYPDPEDVVRARAELAETGVFAEGIYTFADGHKRDAYEAIYEKMTGEAIRYPAGRMDSYAVMRVPAYPWIDHPVLTGVSQKHLGFFFECGPNIKLVSLKAGAEMPAATPVGHRAILLTKGEVAFKGEAFPELSYFMLPGGDAHEALVAKQDTELLVVGWTLPGRSVPFELF